MPEIEYKKSSAVMVFNDKGELALQLRPTTDKVFPSYWDFSAGGGIDPNEDCKVAAKRELQEELGIEVDVEFVSEEHFTYPAWDPEKIRQVDLFIFKAFFNGPFKPNSQEVDKIEFFTIEKIKAMIESGEKVHPELKLSWEKGIITDNTD